MMTVTPLDTLLNSIFVAVCIVAGLIWLLLMIVPVLADERKARRQSAYREDAQDETDRYRRQGRRAR